MIELKRIDSVFLPVKNIGESIEWYADKLSLKIAWKNDCVACFKVGETPLTLLQHGYPGHSNPPEGCEFKPNTHVAFNFYVSDIEQTHQDLALKDVKVHPINDYGNVKDFLFEDLSGNMLSVVTW